MGLLNKKFKFNFDFLNTVVIFSVLFLAFFGYLIVILMNPGASSRSELLNITDYYLYRPIWAFYIISLLLTVFVDNGRELLKTLFIAVPAMCFSFTVLLSTIYNGLNLPTVLLYQLPFLMMVGYSIVNSKKFRVDGKRNFVKIFYYSGVIFIAYFCFFVYKNNIYEFSELYLLRIPRPQIRGGLLQSTEFSNIVAMLFIVGILIANVKSLKERILINSLNIVLFAVLIVLFSTGTLLGLLLFYVMLEIPFKKWSKKKIAFLCIIVTMSLVVMYSLGLFAIITEFAQYKSNDTGRGITYSRLWANILVHPIFGAGIWTSFDIVGNYPHQNILGIWSECGIGSMAIYLGFVAMSVWGYCKYLIYKKNNVLQTEEILYMEICVYSLLFLHFKGIVEDTWFDKQMLLFSGSLLAYILYKNQPKIADHAHIK